MGETFTCVTSGALLHPRLAFLLLTFGMDRAAAASLCPCFVLASPSSADVHQQQAKFITNAVLGCGMRLRPGCSAGYWRVGVADMPA